MNRNASKSVAQLRAIAGAWRERADNTTNASFAEQARRTAGEFDEKAAELENPELKHPAASRRSPAG